MLLPVFLQTTWFEELFMQDKLCAYIWFSALGF